MPLVPAIIFSLCLRVPFSVARDNMATLLTDMGTALKAQGRLEEAHLHYTNALKYNPKYAAAYFNLGECGV